MPVIVKKKKGKYRLVEKATGKIAMRDGSSIDGSGHETKEAAQKQAAAVNISMHKRKKK